MRLRNLLAAVVVASVSLTACGSGDDDTADDDPAGDEPAAGDAGESGGDANASSDGGDAGGQDGTATSGSGRPESVRDDFRVPFPAGWQVDIQGEIGLTEASGAQLLYPNDEYDGIVAFYDDWFEAQPEEFVRSVVGDQVIYQLLGEILYQVSIMPDHEERGESWVVLQVVGGAVN